jgi:predicted Zn-dependent protease
MSEALRIARRVIEIVGDRAEAEASVTVGRDALTRFANSFIHQNVGEEGTTVRLRVAAGGKVSALTGNRVSDDALERLVGDALEAAALQPVDEEWPGLAGAAPVPEGPGADEATVAVEPAVRAALVKDFIDAGGDYLAAGYCDTSHTDIAFANSAGQEASGSATRSTIDGIHQTGESAGSAHQTSRSVADLSGVAAGALAADRARRGMGAFDLKPGDYEVILAPECASTMAVFLTFYGFSGKAVEEGQSFVDLGAQQFDEQITLVDDPLSGNALGVPFDVEGTPKTGLDLVRDGVTAGITHDRRSAGKAGAVSTGHAHEASATCGPMAGHLVLQPGEDSVEDMISRVDRGLYVATFNYCRILDPKSQVVTGLTRNGTFMIENGEITGAVTNLRFTQSFVTALGPGNVLGVGNDLRYADSEFGAGFVRAPSLHLGSWHFTGGAEG